jgi:hypothetical protein
MITLSRFLKNLAYGELSNIAIGNADTGVISPDAYERVITHTQLGLTALHQRFMIRIGQVIIRNYSHIGRYYLDYRYARSNTESTELVKYIEDTAERPFQDNVLKIDQIFDEIGREYELNKSDVPDPIFTPDYNCVVMTPSVENALWTVVYRADHDQLPTTDPDPDLIELKIPQQYLEPLQAYVAGRLMSGMGHSLFEGQAEGDRFMSRYEMLCARLEQQNMDIDDNDTHTRLEDNGWV